MLVIAIIQHWDPRFPVVNKWSTKKHKAYALKGVLNIDPWGNSVEENLTNHNQLRKKNNICLMKHKKNPKIPNQNKILKSNDNFQVFLEKP